ncbi:MAG TPA: hypothetical protein V6C89_03375 [Drouetiella sp.]
MPDVSREHYNFSNDPNQDRNDRARLHKLETDIMAAQNASNPVDYANKWNKVSADLYQDMVAMASNPQEWMKFNEQLKNDMMFGKTVSGEDFLVNSKVLPGIDIVGPGGVSLTGDFNADVKAMGDKGPITIDGKTVTIKSASDLNNLNTWDELSQIYVHNSTTGMLGQIDAGYVYKSDTFSGASNGLGGVKNAVDGLTRALPGVLGQSGDPTQADYVRSGPGCLGQLL